MKVAGAPIIVRACHDACKDVTDFEKRPDINATSWWKVYPLDAFSVAKFEFAPSKNLFYLLLLSKIPMYVFL
jgi:hypothetical protein